MSKVTIDELIKNKAKLEKDIDLLLVSFSLENGVAVDDLKLETYSTTEFCGSMVNRKIYHNKVQVKIVI